MLDERDGAGGDDGADVLLPRGQEQGGRGEASLSKYLVQILELESKVK